MNLSKELTTVTPLSKTIALIMFIILPIIAFLFGMKYQSLINYSQQKIVQQIQQVPTSIPSIISTPEIIVYKKLLFNPQENFVSGKPYPQILRNLNENNLYNLYCTSQYLSNDHTTGNIYVSSKNYQQQLKDTEMVAFLTQKNLELKKNIKPKSTFVFAITKCKTGGSKTLIIYETKATEDGGVYMGYLNTDNLLSNETKITNTSQYLYYCNKPLAFSQNNIFYYHCVYGDGSSGLDEIYAVDLNKNISTKIYQCNSKGTPGIKEPEITCQ